MRATRKELLTIGTGLLGLGLILHNGQVPITETLTVVWLVGSAFLINYIETSDVSNTTEPPGRSYDELVFYDSGFPNTFRGGKKLRGVPTGDQLSNMLNYIKTQVTNAFQEQKLEEKEKKEINDQISTLMVEIITLYRKNPKNPFTINDIETILNNNKYDSLKTFASTLKLEINEEQVQQLQDELIKMGKGGKKTKTYKKRANLKKRKSTKRSRTTKRR